jgi:hypothetical protein
VLTPDYARIAADALIDVSIHFTRDNLSCPPPAANRHRHTWAPGDLTVELECVWQTRSCTCGATQYRRNAPPLPGHSREGWFPRTEALAARQSFLDVYGPDSDADINQQEREYYAGTL